MIGTSRRPAARKAARRGGRWGRLAAAAGAVAFALALASAPAANAHDYLVGSDPKAGATVDGQLSKVTLEFDDIVLDEGGHGALVQVTDSSGRNYESGCASVADRNVTVPVALGKPGQYRVTWQIVSADGHPVSDGIQFDYEGPQAGSGHAGPLAKCGAKVTAPAASSSPQAASGAVISTPVLIALIVAGSIVVLAVIAIAVVLLVTRRRR